MRSLTISDRYRLGECLYASDGVYLYRACDVSFPRNVLVTVFSQCDASAIESLRSRVRSLAGLSHPHIVSIYDLECEADTCCLISEYRECLTLREAIDRGRRFSPEQALFLSVNIAKAIAHAHGKGVVHGQLSSGMIWLQGGDIKVDFGCPRKETPEAGQGIRKDLAAMGEIFKELVVPALSLSRPDARVEAGEILDRLAGRRPPAYTDASDVVRDLKRILDKDRDSLCSNLSRAEERRTSCCEYTETGAGNLAVSDGKRRFRTALAGFSAYFGASSAIVALGILVSFLLFAPAEENPDRLPSGNENQSASVAQAETTSSTITISPEEPIGKTENRRQLIPDLVGLKMQDAERLLLSMGLRYAYYLKRSDAPAGTVFKQEQEPHRPFQPGERVIFYISSGK